MAINALEREACALSFPRFLKHVYVRSDDPLNPTVSPWQPWPYLIERAEVWASGQSEVDLKSRQEGWSWLLAAYYDWRARSGWAIGHISAGQLEARELLTRVQFIEVHLPKWLQAKATFRADDAQYPGGGNIHAFPSTDHAGISFTFQLVGMDEAAFHPYGSQNYAAIRPTVSAGGQFIIGSTADPSLGPSGFMHDMYWASKRGETGYAAVFWPWNARPGRDAAWLARERAAFTGLPEEFDAYYPETDAAAFVGRSGLVYAMFNAARHVKAPRTPIADCVRVVAGIDFGGGDPTAVVILGLDKRHFIHQHAEFYKRGPVSITDLLGFLAPYQKQLDAVMCDPSQGTAIAELVYQGMPARAANNRRDGIGVVGFLLEHDMLSIDPSCKSSIAEFPGYRWADRVDPNDRTRYATKTPVDNHADAMDARRYAAIEITAMIRASAQLPTMTLSGRPLAKVAV